MMKSRLFFRAESGNVIGRGHLSRCVAVADMVKQDFNIFFILLKDEKSFAEQFIVGYQTIILEGLEDVLKILTERDVLWLDAYRFPETLKKEARQVASKVIETNDIPYPAQNVDIIINHTPGLLAKEFDSSPSAALYLGLEYVLLRESFLKAAREKSIFEGDGVFVCFGAADYYNLGSHYVDALLSCHFNEPIYWVVKNLNDVKESQRKENVRILSNLSESEMIYYMEKSKVMLIPSSVLSFEGIALRKPIFTTYFVDNQVLIYEGLVSQSLAVGAGFVNDKDSVTGTIASFLEFYKNEDLHKVQIEIHNHVLDGNSANRIKQILVGC